MSELLDTEELAAVFRVTEKTVRVWRLAGMPAAEEGGQGAGNSAQYRLRDCVEWYFRDSYERLELDRQRTRLASEQADKLAVENAGRRDELGELDLWQRELEKFLGEIRAALLAFPTKVAPRLDGDINQRRDRLEGAIHEVLRSLADYRPSRPATQHAGATEGIGDDPPAAAKTNGKRVGRRQPAAIKRKQRGAGSLEH